MIGYADEPRQESVDVVHALKANGRRRVILLSGDAHAPVAAVARAVGVLRSPAVEDIGVEPAVTDFAGLGAGAPASVFLGGTGLNESRNFSAAT